MSGFYNCLKAEILKSNNSFAVWLSLAGTLSNLLIFFAIHYFSNEWISAGNNPWWGYVNGHYAGIAFMMLPLYVIILCTLVFFMEHRKEMWVMLLTLPVSREQLYWSKQTFTLLLFAAAHVLFVIGILFSGLLMGVIRPEAGLLAYLPDFGQIGKLAFETLWSILGLLALHFWLSRRFAHFIIPLLIGITGFVIVSYLGPGFWANNFSPYAFPIQYMPDYQGEIALARWGGWPYFYWLSPLYFIVFSFAGLWDTRRLT